MNKKAAEELSAKTIIGIVIGIAVLIVLFTIWTKVWGLIPAERKVDQATLKTFQNLVTEINSLEVGKISSLPVSINRKYAIIGFKLDENRIGKGGITCYNSRFVEEGVIKPCEDSCLCLCEIQGTENMCLDYKVDCVDFDGFYFIGEEACANYAVILGRRGVFNINIEKKINTIKIVPEK